VGLNHVTLEDESGKVVRELVADPGVLDGLLAPLEQDRESKCLRFIDPYGDTVFNRMQMDCFLDEWNVLLARARTSAQKSVIMEVARLAEHGRDEPHLYLKFHGD